MACSQSGKGPKPQTAARLLEEAEVALENDSICLGETMLRRAIRLSEQSEDWHTHYIAYQRLAEALSQGNPEEALRLMKKSLAIYEQHPDDERNYVILLDYAGTYASQVAYIHEGSYDEALDFIHRAYDIAHEKQMDDLMCQTLTSLANIAWAKEDYRQAIGYARQAEAIATEELRQGTLQVLARSYLSLNMLDSAETVYRQIEPGDDVHMAYIVQSSLARIALRRMGATQVEDDVDEAFEQVEEFYYKALSQKDEYYQEALRQETENQRLDYRSRMYARTLLITLLASLIVIGAMVLVVRYRMRAEHQEKRRLQEEAEHQKALLHQANEVVAFLQNHILERTEVMKKLNQSGDALISLTPHEWSEIERTLNAIDGNRFANLREQYPTMTEDDIRLCILTRLGVSNRTIGNIYCITISAVQHRKLKLKKDVFGESNPDITLEQILNN
ncbi:MAG: tetratricopeptide repeat protein [Bacteroidaceae bacterium]|nr:tetratricopeptide repeat protein [Bacteroidaceae bacterium]